MTDGEYRLFAGLIEEKFGIQMPPAKKSLIQGRLHKRLAACQKKNFTDYYEYITRNPSGGPEFDVFADLVSTHETAFFREPQHFHFLSRLLADLPSARPYPADSRPLEDRQQLKILCAPCASGEEAYSLAITAAEASLVEKGYDFSVEGVDLSQSCIEEAKRGVYSLKKIETFSDTQRSRYLLRHKNPAVGSFRISPLIRRHTIFHAANLFDTSALFHHNSFDIIFCRNMLIYFNASNQERMVRYLAGKLKPGAYLFLGHAESMIGRSLALRQVTHSVYRNTAGA